MDSDQIRSMLEELHCTATDMDSECLSNLHKACTVIEKMTSAKCLNLVAMAGKRPCLAMFMSDGWSCDIRERVRASSADVVVNRTTRLRTEFVLQRSMIKVSIGSQMHFGLKIERPRPLLEKKCNDIWVAATDHMAMLKVLGHQGISITVYLQDGLMAKPFAKRMAARHKLFFKRQHCPLQFDSDGDRLLAELRDWVMTLTCAAHSASRALKWGMASLVNEPALLEGVHILISSLLRASTGLHLAVGEHVVGRVVFDRHPPDNIEDLEHFWTCLDVEPKILDLVVRVNPFWDGQRLRVSASLADEPDAINMVTTVVRYCMHWVDFSDTRWCKVGQCGRLYLRSLMVGIDHLVQLAVANDAVSKWHLNGYMKFGSVSAKTYLAVAACAGRPSESFLLELLEDDRFLIHHARYWQVLADEHLYLLSLPFAFYSTVADVLKVDVHDYRAQVINASVVSIGYLHMDLWVHIAKAPLKYFIGNVHQNIVGLMAETDVSDPLSAKMQSLAVAGFQSEVESSCLLTREASWTTTLVEQAHGSAAQLGHRHPQLEAETLTCRATVHNSRTLFYPGVFEKQLAKLNHLHSELLRQIDNTKHTGARQAYVSMLIAQCKASRIHGDPSEHALRRAVIKTHAKQFAQLSHGQVEGLRKKAGVIIRKKIESLSESLEHVQSQLRLLHERKGEAAKCGIANHVDSTRFGPEDFLRFSELWDQLSSADLNKMQAPPRKMSSPEGKLLLAQMEELEVAPSEKPVWLSSVVTHRDQFEGTAFYCSSTHPDGSVIYKFVLGIAQPQRAIFLECKRRSFAGHRSDVPLVSGVPFPVPIGQMYEYTGLRFVDHRSVPWTTMDDVLVFPQVEFHGSYVHRVAEAEPWVVFTRYLSCRRPMPDGNARPSHTGRRVRVDQDVLAALQAEFPWLTLEELLTMVNTMKAAEAGAGHGPGHSSGQSSSVVAPEDQEAVFGAVSEQLQTMRADVAKDQTEGEKYFHVKVLGRDKSQTRFRGMCTDIGVAPSDRQVQLWCTGVGWPPKPGQKSFAVHKFGMQGARFLAEELCRRSNYFMSSWVGLNSPTPFSFTELAQAYRLSREFSDWLDELPINSDAVKAALIIGGLVPSPVPE